MMTGLNSVATANTRNRVNILQGEAKASADRNVEFTTVLGSCVATCLFDPVRAIGGLNHFLLPEPPTHLSAVKVNEQYGVYLMEVLINEMMALGAAKSNLKARIYGGANIDPRFGAIGTSNGLFAKQFLAREGIPLTFEDLGGRLARRVSFIPSTGQNRCRTVSADSAPAIRTASALPERTGDVELF